MSHRGAKVLYWAPRLLGLAFAAFITMFAMDVFGEGYKLGELLVALFMHLVPTFMVLAAVAIAWRWEWVGGLVCLGLAILYIVMVPTEFDPIAILLISGPLLLMSGLFFVNWFLRDRIRAARGSAVA